MFHFISSVSEARIRLRKVKEAPKVCKLMQEDVFLSREGKKVFGTLRHSLIFENNEALREVTLVKDKGERVCLWTVEDWNSVLKQNAVENLIGMKYHIDEYKENLIPYAQKADGSYFIMTISFSTCALSDVKNTEKLDLPKCESSKKKRSKKRASKKK